MEFFGRGVDDDLNDLIKWLEDPDRPENEYMETTGIPLLEENGYIATKKKIKRASIFKGTKNNTECSVLQITVKNRLKKDHLIPPVSEIIKKFKTTKDNKEKVTTKKRSNPLCLLPIISVDSWSESIKKKQDLTSDEKVRLSIYCGRFGNFVNNWRIKIQKKGFKFDESEKSMLTEDLTKNYAQWVWKKMTQDEKVNEIKRSFLSSLIKWKKQVENNMDIKDLDEAIRALIEYTSTFEYPEIKKKNNVALR